MQIKLDLLAPARNVEIGIAAIDCGADAVYIAGPAFGARAAAGNSVEDIARLCRHAHLYGAKIHATVNTLLQGAELAEACRLMWELYAAGVDVFIVQDLNLLSLDLPPVELHASTQTAIRTPERARELASLGFSCLVLERQLTLEQIRAIRAAVPSGCALEFFIHGALCVGYSGQCYLSQHLTGRSANRGVCAQACRSRYDLVDADGRVLVRDRTLLSPKDLRFDRRLPDLVAAGITSFKIEGRLKNVSYVKNVVRHYRKVIDQFIVSSDVMPASGRASVYAAGDAPSRSFCGEPCAESRSGCEEASPAARRAFDPLHSAPVMPGSSPVMPGATGHRYARASAGHLEGGFAPDPDKTFGRGWTEAFLDDRTAKIASEDAAKSMGEYIGEIVAVKDRDIEVRTAKTLANGDGLSFVGRSGKVVGSRAEVVAGGRVTLRDAAPLSPGMRVYRNYDIRFERDLENNMPHRFIDASISWRSVSPSFPARPGILSPAETIVTAVTEDGIRAEKRFADGAPVAEKPEAALESLRRQLGKHSGPFAFAVQEVSADPVRFYPAAFLNGIRRELASQLQQHAENRPRREVPHTPLPQAGALNRSTLEIPQELLRSRYCIRWEQGLCPRICPVAPGMTPDVQPDMTPDAHPGVTSGVTPGLTGGLTASPLYLVNNGRRLRLQFDCTRCEMTIQRWH